VDLEFNNYYERVLNGDLTALLGYLDDHDCYQFELPPSFYELVGQLVLLQHMGAAKQILARIVRRGRFLGSFSTEHAYRYWYRVIKRACDIARDFIRAEYETNSLVKRKELWTPYIEQCYLSRRHDYKGVARSEEIRKWRDWAEAADSQGREPPSLNDLVDRFSVAFLVPQVIFFELAESFPSYGSPAGRDKRRRIRRFRWTPSYVARKYAAAMVNLSAGTVSRKYKRK
jgi:hypothetical protein